MGDATMNPVDAVVLLQQQIDQLTMEAEIKHFEMDRAIDSGYLLVMSFMVFFMQAGFIMLEAGSVRNRNATSIILKNIGDCMLGIIMYFLFGYGFAFGDSENANGFSGSIHFGLRDLPPDMLSFFFWQMMFASTASTIVSGGVAGRTRYQAYFSFTSMLTGFIYPVVSHWVWSEHGWLGINAGLFGTMGLRDHAGSLVVHTVGGMAGLVGAIVTGPRRGFFNSKTGKPQRIWGHSTVFAALGTFVLWFCWFGFNSGSSLGVAGGKDAIVAKVAVNTALCSAAAGLTTILLHRLHYELIYKRNRTPYAPFKSSFDLMTTMNGMLGGLVAITAPCAFVDPWAAVVIGIIASPVFLLGDKMLERLAIDDPLAVSSVHGWCGVWGTLSVGIFGLGGDCGAACDGWVYGGGHQFAVQLVGTLVVILWTVVLSFIAFVVFDRISGLRVSAREELLGLDYELGGKENPEWYQISEQLNSNRKLIELINDPSDPKLGKFAEFLSREFCLESLDFILAVSDFEQFIRFSGKELSPDEIRMRAVLVYNLYITASAPKQVNLSDSMKKSIESILTAVRFDYTLFDAARQDITDVLDKGPFKRFMRKAVIEDDFQDVQVPKFNWARITQLGRHQVTKEVYRVDENTSLVVWDCDLQPHDQPEHIEMSQLQFAKVPSKLQPRHRSSITRSEPSRSRSRTYTDSDAAGSHSAFLPHGEHDVAVEVGDGDESLDDDDKRDL